MDLRWCVCRAKIEQGLLDLKGQTPAGETFMHEGMAAVSKVGVIHSMSVLKGSYHAFLLDIPLLCQSLFIHA